MKKRNNANLNKSLFGILFLVSLAICCTKVPDPEEPPISYPTRYTSIYFKNAATGLPIEGIDVSFWLELGGSGSYSFAHDRKTYANGLLVLQWSGTGKNETSYRLFTRGNLSLPDTFQLSKPLSDTTVTIFLQKITNNLLGFNGQQFTTYKANIINGQLLIAGFILTDSVAVGEYPLGVGQYNALSSSESYDCIQLFDNYYCQTHSYFSGFANQSGTEGKIEITRINWQDSVVWGRFEGVTGLQNDGSLHYTYQDGSFDSLSFRFLSGIAGAPRPFFSFSDAQDRPVKHRNITAVRTDTTFEVTMTNYGDSFHFTLPLDIQPGIYTAAELAVSTSFFNAWVLSSYLDPDDTIQITEVDMVNHRIKGTLNLDLSWSNNYRFIFKNGSFQVNWE